MSGFRSEPNVCSWRFAGRRNDRRWLQDHRHSHLCARRAKAAHATAAAIRVGILMIKSAQITLAAQRLS